MTTKGIRFMTVLMFVVLFSRPSAGSPSDFEGKTVGSIQFAPRGRADRDHDLLAGLPLKIGQPFRMADVHAAIEYLYATNRFADIAVDAELVDGKVAVRLLITNNWFIGRVSARRISEPPSRGQLENSAKLDLGTQFSEAKLDAAVRNVRKILRNNGFYEAAVTPRIEHLPQYSEVNIRFDIDPGPRARYEEPILTGHPRKSEKKIIAATRWKRWFLSHRYKQVTQERTGQGLERIRNSYHKDKRLMARVTLEDLDYHPVSTTLTPTIDIESGPQVVIKAPGSHLSSGKLKALIPVYEEQAVDRDLLIEGQRNITEYLQSLGYFNAKVRFTPVRQQPGRESIRFDIERGERFKVVALAIEGNHYFDTATIRERMDILPAGFIRYQHGRFSEQYLHHDLAEITDLYRANGFRTVKVTSKTERNYEGKSSHVGITIHIDEGPQWFVDSIRLAGVSKQSYNEVLKLLESNRGQPFSDVNVAADQDNVLGYYYNLGYPNVTVEPLVENAGTPNRVNIRYTVKTGRRQFVKDVIISGLEATKPGMVTQRITLKPGDPLSQSAIVDSQRRLYDLGILAQVNTAIQNPDGIEPSKYVLYELEEARKWMFDVGFGAEIARIGGGVGDLTQPAGATGFSPRGSLGITRSNLFGIGHSIGLQTQVSTIEQRALVTYEVPHIEGSENMSLTFTGLFDDSKNVRTFAAQREEATAQIGQRLSKTSSIQYRVTYRRVSVDSATLNITPQLIPLLSQPVRIGQVSSAFIQDRRDDPVDTTHGTYDTIDVGVASKAFASQSPFLRIVGKNSTYYRFGDCVLARSLTFGWINNLGSLEIPLPERFFAGGAVTQRGFPDNQAGPRDLVTGFPIGGNAMLFHQTEWRFPFIGNNIRGVFFHDMGNVFSDISDISLRYHQRGLQDFNYMEQAVGFGIRYRTPIGPIRLDLAYSMNPPSFVGFQGTRDQLLYCGSPNPPSNISCAGVYNVRQQISHFQFHFSLGQTF